MSSEIKLDFTEREGSRPEVKASTSDAPNASASVTLWTTAKSGPMWRIYVNDQATQNAIEETLRRALVAYHRLEAELASPAPRGGAPDGADPAGDAESRDVRPHEED